MRTSNRVMAAVAVAVTAMAAAATPAFASASSSAGVGQTGHAVFVQTDNAAGNLVVAYDRAADGTLALAAATPPAAAVGSWPVWWSTTPRPRARWPTTRRTACSTR